MEKALLLRKIFPQSLGAGGEAFVQKFLAENLEAHFFPMFLKSQGASQALQEQSHFEAVVWQLTLEPSPKLGGSDHLQLNPTFQWLEMKDKIYALWRRPEHLKVQELALSSAQAYLLETLSLDRKFQFAQLVEWMNLHYPSAGLSEGEWSKVLKNLIDLEIVF